LPDIVTLNLHSHFALAFVISSGVEKPASPLAPAKQQFLQLRSESQEGGGLRSLISASVRRPGLAMREHRFLISPLPRLAGKSVENSNDGAVGG